MDRTTREASPLFPALALSPNPFTEWLNVRYQLAKAGRTELEVFDASGRVIRMLGQSVEAPGNHVVQFDGRDDLGRRFAPGIYFVRLRTDGVSSDTRKVVLSR
jgi:hypothetical protein